jgi:hypothetical protein
MRAHVLLPAARERLSPAFRQNQISRIDLSEYRRVAPDAVELPLDEMARLLERAQTTFAEAPVASDQWLAPRLHALLRLDRHHASDKHMWAWMAADVFPDYARWRFVGKNEDREEDESKRGTPLKRFFGQDRDNVLSRLWWGGELCRDGGDYSPVEQAFLAQDVPNTWFSLDAFHHRACAQAALRYVPKMGSTPINRLSTALDHVLTTIQLDVVAPASPPDTSAIAEWRELPLDIEELLDDRLPAGPDETPVDPDQIDAADALLRRVAREMNPPLELLA